MNLYWPNLIVLPIVIILSIWVGGHLGAWHKKRAGGAEIAPLSSVVGACLGLFAFMLGFTFSMTASRFQIRKETLFGEVDAINTAYLKAGLLKDPYNTRCKKMVAEYVNIRAELESGKSSIQRLVDRSNQILDSLWSQVETMAHDEQSSRFSFDNAVIEMKKSLARRVEAGLYSGIPTVIIWVLYFVSFFSMMLLGFQFGVSGKSNLIVSTALAVIFSAVMWLILDLDNPAAGIIKVDQRPIFELQKEINKHGLIEMRK